jgi:hypothetical protein
VSKEKNGNAPDQASDGEKIKRPPNRPSTLHLMFGWWSQYARHKLATCSPQARNIARNMYTMSWEEGGTTWKKCSQHGKMCSHRRKSVRNTMLDVGPNMLATNLQHVRHKLATSLATCTLCQGRREGAQHGKSVRNMGKCVRNMEKVFATWEKVFATFAATRFATS